MPKTNNHYTSVLEIDYTNTSTLDFLRTQSAHTAAFLQTKLALAAEVLVSAGFTHEKIADSLGLPSKSAVHMLIKHWGSNGLKKGGLK